ncbi:MAG: hypothetical protein IH586_15740, partial [Anaerolineaceae bacterium]|nr:hypothetical protein [Anaerolineaceae bacterium]
MLPLLLAVKFYIPKPRSALTARQDLLDRFTTGLGRSLTLISAPAGFGKSTLLSAWFEKQAGGGDPDAKAVFCWLSLDPRDNQAARFWTYLVAAIQTGVQNRQLESSTPP